MNQGMQPEPVFIQQKPSGPKYNPELNNFIAKTQMANPGKKRRLKIKQRKQGGRKRSSALKNSAFNVMSSMDKGRKGGGKGSGGLRKNARSKKRIKK